MKISSQVKHQHVRMCLCIHTQLQSPFYLIARSSWLPWEGQFPRTQVTMPRLEDLTEGPSGSENYEIPHPCALQNTATGAESKISSAYKELLVYLEWKTTLWYKTKWRSLSSSEKGVMQALGLKVPMTRVSAGHESLRRKSSRKSEFCHNKFNRKPH